ncbi:MAG: magnesium transporter [Thermosphaera aggregans]|uniref:magnesium transporter n=1 Tax=Thermosphaera aggregans TaxID=54254 RepID=UPI003BFEEC4F
MPDERVNRLLISMGALGVGTVLAGLSLHTSVEILIQYPVFLMLIPGLMDLRGNVYGALGYRLTTALHIGETEPRILSKFNLYNVLISYSVTIIASVIMALLAYIISASLDLSSPGLLTLLFISLASSTIVYLILTPLTTLSIILLFKTGRDPTDFVASIVTGVGDALTPFTFIAVSSLFQALSPSLETIIVASLSSVAIVSVLIVWRAGELRTLLENTVSSVAASFGSSLGGLFLATKTALLEKLPLILGSLPAFNALIGAGMGVIGNSLNVKLHLGVENSLHEYIDDSKTIALTTFVAVLVSLLTVSGLTLTSIQSVGISVLIIGLSFPILFLTSSLLTFYLTQVSFKMGWDPDNLVFPLMTTFVDLNGPLILSSVAGFFV